MAKPSEEILDGIPAFEEARFIAAREVAEKLAYEVVGMTHKQQQSAAEYISIAIWRFEFAKYAKKRGGA